MPTSTKSAISAVLGILAAFLCVCPATAQTLAGVTGDIQVVGDFDGDGFLDYAYWRPSNGTWYVHTYVNPTVLITTQFGLPGDIPVPGNYTNSGRTDYAVWRPSNGTWYIQPANGGASISTQWGLPGDIPIVADFGAAAGPNSLTVWRPSNGTWYILPSLTSTASVIVQFGLPGDVPVPADYDGDGRTDFAVWRPSNGTWYISSTGGLITQQFGLPGDVPAPADYDGDGRTDYAVYRPSEGNMYQLLSSNPANPVVQAWALPIHNLFSKWNVGTLGPGLYVRVFGDFDGDGKLDWAVWRPKDGMWLVVPSSNPVLPPAFQWGLPGDVPIPGNYSRSVNPSTGFPLTDYVVWRPSNGTWYIEPANDSPTFTTQWGLPGDIPQFGDFDRDGKVDYAVYRPSSASWYLQLSSGGTASHQFGLPGDIPTSGEYIIVNEPERTNITVWRPSDATFYTFISENALTKAFGLPGDLPVPADINNDGGTDYAVWRPSAQSWFYNINGDSSTVYQIQLGVAGNDLLYNQPPLTTFIGPR